MNTYNVLKKVYVLLNMINANYADNTPIVELQKLPMFAQQSLLKTIHANGFQDTAEIDIIVNAGEENDTVFIVVMGNENWPMTVDRVMTPSGNSSFVISIPNKLFINIEPSDAAPIIYHIFADIAQYDSNLLYVVNSDLINSYAAEAGIHVPTYDLMIQMFVIYLANSLISSWWVEEGFHSDMKTYLDSKDYDTVTINNILQKLFDEDVKNCLENFVSIIEL